jgi:hypothetical protein
MDACGANESGANNRSGRVQGCDAGSFPFSGWVDVDGAYGENGRINQTGGKAWPDWLNPS